MIKKGVGKKGLSPVVATVLLIGVVIIMGVIVFLWFNGMKEETITKFGGTNVELVCNDLIFSASYSGGVLYITNTGDVPIYSMNVKTSDGGSYDTHNIRDLEFSGGVDWPSNGLNQGSAFSGTISLDGTIELIPILLGTSDTGETTYVCEEMYSKELS